MVDVSVLTPSFGYGRFIEEAILSVLAQDGVSVEHVVQDALSSDETVDVLRRFDGQIAWASEPDQGQADALNKALARASGTWVAWLNADEFYLPHCLATLLEQAERTAADVVYGDCVFVDVEGKVDRLLPQHRFSARILREYGCFIPSCALLLRRSILGDAPWDPTLKRIMDWDLFMNLLMRGARFRYLAYPGAAFRAHEDRVTAGFTPAFQEEENKIASRYGLPYDRIERWEASRRGRWLHPFYKLIGGAYTRQRRAQSLRGRDIRWFKQGSGQATWISLMRTCYGWRRDDDQTGRRHIGRQ
ncbi:MAG: glycosyltransferase family 2 protein [bacterium]